MVLKTLTKSLTGIRGLDDITGGGLPTGRSTLVVGSAGSGKTLFAMEFLVHGVVRYNEPGVFMTFEETADDLAENVASLGFDLPALIAAKKLALDHVYVERSQIHEAGEYNLEGLFIRLAYAIDSIGAKRVVLDTLEGLFSGLPDPAILRAELRRLFLWLKEKGVTAIITGERGEGSMTRYGIEEYVSDCVIVLDHRVSAQMSIRRLRIVKYRGSVHGTNEYPFLIDELGFSVLPVTSLGLNHVVSKKRVTTGIARLDTMLGGQGYFRGSSILLSGTAGSGKTSVAAHFTDATCRRGERCLSFLFEESPSQLKRNMSSIGINLQQWEDKGLLRFHAARPSLYGMEMHLAITLRAITEFEPSVVILDPINAFSGSGDQLDMKAFLVRLTDFVKEKGITVVLVTMPTAGTGQMSTDAHISSLIDTWVVLLDFEMNGERNRGINIIKSRGMAHSNQIREFLLTDHGVELADVYIGPAGLLTGSARKVQEAHEQADQLASQQDTEQQRLVLERKREAQESQIAALRAEFDAYEVEAKRFISQSEHRGLQLLKDRLAMGRKRQADVPTTVKLPGTKATGRLPAPKA